MGVEVNSGYLMTSVYILPNYQNDYAAVTFRICTDTPTGQVSTL